MSVNIDRRTVPPGNDTLVDDAWKLKERIRREEGVLKQRHGFFVDAYRRSTGYIFVDRGEEETLVAFASVRRDGYILFLAVNPDYRGEGFGRQLVAEVADNHQSVTCHARVSNENAVTFYDHLGFEIDRRIDNYYEDGGDAYYLRLGSDDSLTDRLSEFVRR